MTKPDGIDTIITTIKIYKKNDFLEEFERQYQETQSHRTTISNSVLAYRHLKAANLHT